MEYKFNRNYCFLDFEYNSTSEERLNLVSCAWVTYTHSTRSIRKESFWIHQAPEAQAALRSRIEHLHSQGFVFVCFNGVAEGSAFYSLGLNPTEFQWVDLQNEWKMLTNHCHEYAYGWQLIRGKKVYTDPPKPKWEQTEEDKLRANNSKCEKSLSAMKFKLLGIAIDTEHKTQIRNLIISNDALAISNNREAILDYNLSDVEHLPRILEKVSEAYIKARAPQSFKDLLWRGAVSADCALITCKGYPVNRAKVMRFAQNVPKILQEIAEDINAQFPEIGVFEWNNLRQAYTMKQKPLRDWVSARSWPKPWRRTDKGDLSLSLDAWADFFHFRHDYPQGNLGAQMLRYLKTKQSMNGFMPKAKGETFFDSLGLDDRVRPYLNPYGAQSGRYQPKATSYIPLKAAWMRSLIEPKEGRAIVGMDYASEEFLISACWSEDVNMFKAYKSGDVYLYFAKLAGAVPWDGKKEDFKETRNLFKATTLGISYLMGAKGLADKISQDTGKEYTQEDAQGLIDDFNKAYPNFSQSLFQEQYAYLDRGYQVHPDGWMMWGDNQNRRSVANCPIQGRGSVILRRAIHDALKEGLEVILPLHDALYVECAIEDVHKSVDLLKRVMVDAFVSAFTGKGRKMAEAIRVDANVWGPKVTALKDSTPGGVSLKLQEIYIDDRSVSEYEKFKTYFQ